MKFSELRQQGLHEAAKDHILRHGEILRALLIASGDRGEHYALWTNSGAAIALLSFMAASDRLRALPAAWHALICFAFGVVSCGLLCASNYHVRSSQFLRWLDDSEEFFADRIDYAVLFGNLNRRSRSWWAQLPVVFAYMAFVSFIAGLIVALTQLMPGSVTAPVLHSSSRF